MKRVPFALEFCGECSPSPIPSNDDNGKACKVIPAAFPDEPENDEKQAEASLLSLSSVPMVRSTLHIEGMCCASEVPAIRRILRGHTFDINITTRTIYVQHPQNALTQVCERLQRSGFPATVLRDGTLTAAVGSPTAMSSVQVKSTFRLLQLDMKESLLLRNESGLKNNCILQDCEVIQSVTVENEGDDRDQRGNSATTLVVVSHDPLLMSDEEIKSQLEEMYGCSVEIVLDHSHGNIPEPPSLRWHVVASGLFWLLSIGGELQHIRPLAALGGIAAVLTGLPVVATKAFRTVCVQKRVDANVMMLIAATGAIGLGEWQEAASVAFLFSVSGLLERRTTRRATQALSNVLNLQPEYGTLINGRRVPAVCIPVGTHLLVRPGDKIAADGRVLAGSAELDQSSLTGESRYVSVQKHDTVKAGSIHCGGTTVLTMETTASFQDSDVSRLVRLVEQAATNKSETENLIDQFAAFYTPLILGLAALMATIPWLFLFWIGNTSSDNHQHNQTPADWTMNALILIVISCPCALTISTPVTYAAGLGAAAAQGIVVKGGGILERVGSTTTVVLDKTGTLTTGKFRVAHLDAFHWKRQDVLRLLLRVESNSSHPLARTLVDAAKREGIEVTDGSGVEQIVIVPGQGITGVVDGKKCFVGNQRLLEDSAAMSLAANLSPEYLKKVESWNDCGTVGFVGIEGEGILACYSLIDVVRPEAGEVLDMLQSEGVKVFMLTGDSKGAAHSVAKQVGLDEQFVHAQLLPEDKLHFVGSLKRPLPSSFAVFRQNRNVLFCGDGVNDVPAMAAAADIGVAMGEGAAVAMEMSDIALMDSDLSKLYFVMKLGKKVLSTVRENIFISLFCKALVTALTFAGYMTLFYAIASDIGVMLLVTVNGLKLLPMTDSSHGRPRYDALSTSSSTMSASDLELI
jgi:Zn2+/Cd2+-exporting ATPase